MRYCKGRNVFVIGVLVLFFGTSFSVVCTQADDMTTSEVQIDQNKIDAYINLFDKDVQGKIHQLINNNLSVYFTLSTSGVGKASRVYFPYFLRTIKPRGLFLATLIIYQGISAVTLIIELNSETGLNSTAAYGPHALFIIGIGYTFAKRNTEGGKGSIAAVSATKPLVL
jgi:hypothetical protein